MFKKLIIISILFVCALPVFAKEEIEVIRKEAGIWIFKIDTTKYKNRIKPVVDYTTSSELFSRGNYTLVVNGGFFDMTNGNPISYVVIDKETVETPLNNQKLMEELISSGRSDAVLNRTEFRILEDKKGNLSYDIVPHFEEVKEGKTIKHSIQGGPLMLPKLNWVEESFVKFDKNEKVTFESCAVTKRRPRTLLGLKGKYLYIILFTSNRTSSLNEAYDYITKHVRLDKLMALDGGGSTSLNYKDIKIFSEGTEGRKVKSFLVIEDEK